MNNLLKIGLFIFLLCAIGGCGKEDVPPVSGSLNVVFTDERLPDELTVFTEAGSPIYEMKVSYQKIDLDLNAGNYRIRPFASGSSYASCDFQIVAGRTTRVIYIDYTGLTELR